MKKKFSVHFVIRLLSAASLLLVVLTGVLVPSPGNSFLASLTLAFLLGGNILIIYPLSGESLSFSLNVSIILLCFWIPGRILGWDRAVLLLSGMAGVITVTILNAREKYSHIRKLFSSSSVWQSVEDNARSIYFKLYTVAIILLFCPGCRIPAAVFSTWLYAALYYRAYTTSTLIMTRKKEISIRDMAAGNPRLMAEPGNGDSNMDRLYDRVLKHMEEKKPFLDSEFTLMDLATATYSNKTYLSRTINLYSGKNFRQFLNTWRINYAKELIEKDKRLRMAEVSTMCGFHTVVSFNMAFKVITGLTPTEYHGSVHTKLQ